MVGASEWEREAYTTIQVRRFDKTRIRNHSFPREPTWKTVSRLLDVIDMMEKYGGWTTIKRKLDSEER
jgi:hypothetical protein